MEQKKLQKLKALAFEPEYGQGFHSGYLEKISEEGKENRERGHARKRPG